MVTDTKRLSIIQHVLEEKDETVIEKIEAILMNGSFNPLKKESTIYDFAGIITNEEAEEMQRVIDETCRKIHPDDWK